MAKYLYVLGISKELDGLQRIELHKDLCRVFATEEVTLVTAKEVRLHSSLDPGEVEPEFRRLTGKYGPVEMRAGAKLE